MAANSAVQIELHQRIAPRYERRYGDAASRAFHRGWHGEMLREVELGGDILDVGCGPGRLLADAAHNHARRAGIDLSPAMLAGAAHFARGAALVCGDAQVLPFRAGSFDALLLKGCLHHLRDHRAFLREAWRALRPGGLLVISEPQNDAPWVRLARWGLYRLSSAYEPGDRGFRTRALEEMVRAAGFDLLSSRPFGLSAYVAAGFPDTLPLLRWLPGSAWLARILMALDEVVLALPPLGILAFQRLIAARKRGSR